MLKVSHLQWLQTTLWERYKIRTIRRTLNDVALTGRLDDQRNLWVGNIPIALAYYRAGYSPDDYPSPDEWDARFVICRTRIVFCSLWFMQWNSNTLLVAL